MIWAALTRRPYRHEGDNLRDLDDKAERYILQPKQDEARPTPSAPATTRSPTKPQFGEGDIGRGMSERILNPISAAEFEGKPVPQRKWEVEQYIPRCKPVLLYGDGGAGKTTIAAQLAACKSARKDWLGLKTQPGRTLYISAEDDNDELHFRLDCIRANMGLQWADLADVQLQSLLDKDPALGEFSSSMGGLSPCCYSANWR